jgi:hypothetical protein
MIANVLVFCLSFTLLLGALVARDGWAEIDRPQHMTPHKWCPPGNDRARRIEHVAGAPSYHVGTSR